MLYYALINARIANSEYRWSTGTKKNAKKDLEEKYSVSHNIYNVCINVNIRHCCPCGIWRGGHESRSAIGSTAGSSGRTRGDLIHPVHKPVKGWDGEKCLYIFTIPYLYIYIYIYRSSSLFVHPDLLYRAPGDVLFARPRPPWPPQVSRDLFNPHDTIYIYI